MSIDIWDSVPDIELDEEKPPVRDYSIRTKPLYPDPAPELTEAMWARLKAERAAAREPEEDDAEYEITVTQEAEEFDDPISALAGVVKLAHNNGWTLVSLGHSRAFAKGRPFKTGANEGKPRPDQEIEQQWAYFQKDGVGRISVSYEIVNGAVRSTNTSRKFNGQRYADKELKEIIKR